MEPRQGIHRYRTDSFFDLATVDVVLTVLAAVAICYVYGPGTFIPALVGLFALGELTHYLLGIQTRVLQVLN